jgi:hypothetical protein
MIEARPATPPKKSDTPRNAALAESVASDRPCAAVVRPALEKGKPAMNPELIQPTIGLAFLAIWALVGQIIIRSRKQ